MESTDLYEVERITDEWQDLDGKRHYLVQWKGYGRDSDTWEPEENLVDCDEALQDFRLWQAEQRREGAPGSPRSPRCPVAQLLFRPPPTDSGHVGPVAENPAMQTIRLFAGSQSVRVTEEKTTLKVKMPMPWRPLKKLFLEKWLQDCREIQVSPGAPGHEEPVATPVMLQGPNLVAADTDFLERDGSPCPDHCGLQGCGLESELKPLGDGAGSPWKADLVVTRRSTRKASLPNRPDRHRPPVIASRTQALETLARFRWSPKEGHQPYKDIAVRKQEAYTHIILYSRSSHHNCLNPGIMQEMQHALNTAAKDDSRFVLLGAAGSAFCCGLDLAYLSRSLVPDPAKVSISMVRHLKSFVSHFIQFRKPLVVAVNGPAMGLGASILALCDIVWSNDKAWFQTPYTAQGLTPHGCCSLTFPKIMGRATASEMLFRGQKLTAQEACDKGLVSQVFSQHTFMREVTARVRELASCHPLVLEECKTLLCCSAKADLEQANIRECEVLKSVLASPQGDRSLLRALEHQHS